MRAPAGAAARIPVAARDSARLCLATHRVARPSERPAAADAGSKGAEATLKRVAEQLLAGGVDDPPSRGRVAGAGGPAGRGAAPRPAGRGSRAHHRPDARSRDESGVAESPTEERRRRSRPAAAGNPEGRGDPTSPPVVARRRRVSRRHVGSSRLGRLASRPVASRGRTGRRPQGQRPRVAQPAAVAGGLLNRAYTTNAMPTWIVIAPASSPRSPLFFTPGPVMPRYPNSPKIRIREPCGRKAIPIPAPNRKSVSLW